MSNMNGKYAPPEHYNDAMGGDFMLDMFIDSLGPSTQMMDSNWDQFNSQNFAPRYTEMQMPPMQHPHWQQSVPMDQSNVMTNASHVNHQPHPPLGHAQPMHLPPTDPKAAAATKTKRKYGLQAVEMKVPRARKHMPTPEDLKKEQIVMKNGKNASLFAIEKRRERNKVLARKTREKKKIEIENLREEAANLKVENERLKELLAKNDEETKDNVPGDPAASTWKEPSKSSPSTVSSSKESDMSSGKTSGKDNTSIHGSFCVLDMSEDGRDKKIVSASPGFVDKLGYSLEEIIGRDFHFIFGENTDSSSLEMVDSAIRDNRGYKVYILNYRKDGTSFWSKLRVSPLAGTNGKISHFLLILAKTDTKSASSLSNSASNSSSSDRESKSSTSSSFSKSGDRSGNKRKGEEYDDNTQPGRNPERVCSTSSRRDILESLRDGALKKNSEDHANNSR
jgi:PAS domain S-box-containing protein